MSISPVTNIAQVLKALMLEIQTRIPSAKVVYDNDLSYVSAMEKLRAKNNQNDVVQNQFPMLVFKRTPLKPAYNFIGERGAKMVNPRLPLVGQDAVANYRSAQSEFEIQFMYYVNSVESGEEFEITYLSETGLSGIELMDVDLGTELGTHQYSLDWKDLEDFTLNDTDSYYAAYTASIVCMGWFFLLDSVQTNTITTINADIKGANEELFTTLIIE